ncbi:MAG: Fic family protein [uncultured Sulfurovum sp.]|uniref:Fic family protein n=1 Tax=uncultured Sulfurovum sp. TaxID=269237 RepID=A0A6S6SC76_9BACT|nr:MAG: Fic family protein [uncultured Sulfurovum sp.]
MNTKKWIWQHQDFPNFNYNYKEIEPMIFHLIEKSGELKGKISYLSDNEQDNFSIETSLSEIIATSEIEGVELKRDSVRSSLQKKLNITFNREEDKSTKNSDSLTELYIDSRFNQDDLSIDRLHKWHHAIFEAYSSILYPVNKGVFRDHDDMQIVSGSIGKEKIHYVAIPQNQIESSIQELIKYINGSNENFIVKSAVAHLWFESIHPYDDGNGRIGRAIVNYILAKEGGLDNRYYSISSAINQSRKEYYNKLEKTQKLVHNPKLELTEWIQWHTESIEKSIEISIENIQKVVEKTKFHDKVRHIKLNDKQTKVINKLLDLGEGNFQGGLTNKKYRGLTKTDAVTASRHLKDMLNKGIIREIEGYSGRSTRYELDI